jgi:nucleoside-diphosphate-sugar epimerase
MLMPSSDFRKRAVVTGAAGFIGSTLTERLLDRGVEVTAVDRMSDYYDPAVKAANVAGGSRVTVLDVLAILGRIMDCEVEVEHGSAARGDARDTSGDTAKAARDLGYLPSVSLEEGLTAQVEAALERVRS